MGDGWLEVVEGDECDDKGDGETVFEPIRSTGHYLFGKRGNAEAMLLFR